MDPYFVKYTVLVLVMPLTIPSPEQILFFGPKCENNCVKNRIISRLNELLTFDAFRKFFSPPRSATSCNKRSGSIEFQDTTRTTMDAVPHKFVDSVVGMFSRESLDELALNVTDTLWKPVINLHYRNVVYYGIVFRKEKNGIKHLFLGMNDKVDLSVSTRIIRENGRFARIRYIKDFGIFPSSYWNEVDPLGEAETCRLLKTVTPLIDQVSSELGSYWGTPWGVEPLLPSLFKRVHFRSIKLHNCGQISHDFLEDQINNSLFLNSVWLLGSDWPQSTVELLWKMCLKGRPGKYVTVSLTTTLIDTAFIRNLFDHWKENGNLHFKLCCPVQDKDGIRALMGKEKIDEQYPFPSERVFIHEREKSIAILSEGSIPIKCYTCECDRSKVCLLNIVHPQYHDA
uniref:F-box domain-containing protein n=1 Tax=Steinernema glaseri TaxID=37863 RepID=A0A1I8AE58_9BILA